MRTTCVAPNHIGSNPTHESVPTLQQLELTLMMTLDAHFGITRKPFKFRRTLYDFGILLLFKHIVEVHLFVTKTFKELLKLIY